MTNETKTVKFLKKGVRDAAGKYYPCWYSLTKLVDGRVAVTLYAKSILKGLPRELRPENNTDITTDYFENDRVRFYEGTSEFGLLKGLCS
jgi:hypothetical protein